jgi:dynein heavy chain, axonemal
MKNSLEGIVIKWAFQVDEVLKENSSSLFDKNNHPTPMAELTFWENRRKNVKNIYDQLRDPRVKKVGSVLELINSVYFNTFTNTFKAIVTALHEANDITLWLKPLVSDAALNKLRTNFSFHSQGSHFERIERDEFLENETKIRPLYHVICMMWAHSKYYGLNNRMITLFRMINNLMIESATKYLDPGSLFQSEPDESLANIAKVVRILEEHKKCFKEYREKLPDSTPSETSSIQQMSSSSLRSLNSVG